MENSNVASRKQIYRVNRNFVESI